MKRKVRAPSKTRVSMTEDQLWHIFITFEDVLGAGSINKADEEIGKLLARALLRRGVRSDGLERYQKEWANASGR